MTGSALLFNFCSWLVLVISTASTLALSISSSNNGNRVKRISIVTGANGYVGREVVNVLLNTNNNANKNDGNDEEDVDEILCLVRSHRVESETKYWSRFKSSLLASTTGTSKTPTIKVLPYDMLDGGKSITDALNAAVNNDNDSDSSSTENNNDIDPEICVYHIASVFGPSEDHIKVAKENVQGTKDLVCAIGEFPKSACCRLVVTSSMAAVRGSGQIPMNNEYYTHQDWNTQSKLEDNNWGASYQWSKAESERIAWKISNDMKIKMTSICPSFVFGPPTSIPSSTTKTDSDEVDTTTNLSNSFSITLFGQWVRGTSPIQSRLFVDVRDVAKAHVAAGTKSDAIGERIIVSTEARIPSKEMADILKDVCTESGLSDPEGISFDSTFKGGAIPIGSREAESTDRLFSLLGITLTPVHET